MAKSGNRLSKQERRKRRQKAESRRLDDAKKIHFDNQIGFIKQAQMNAFLDEPVSIPKKHVTFRCPAPLLNDLEYLAFEMGVTRSELFVLAMQTFVQKKAYLQTGNYSEVLHEEY